MRAIRIFAHLSLDGVVSPESQDSDYLNGLPPDPGQDV